MALLMPTAPLDSLPPARETHVHTRSITHTDGTDTHSHAHSVHANKVMNGSTHVGFFLTLGMDLHYRIGFTLDSQF